LLMHSARRTIERAILEEVLETLDATFDDTQRSIVLAGRNWHPGVIGIVAAQVFRRYNRPAILITVNEDGVGRGSARGPRDFNMVEALAACAHHLEQFGGHKAAAGMTVLEGAIKPFKEAFEAETARQRPDGDSTPVLEVDALVSLSEIDSRLLRTIDRLQPFGHGNRPPVLCSCGVQPLPNSVRELRGGHLKFDVRQGSSVFSAIGFRMAERLSSVQAVDAVDIAYTPQFNTWRGETSIQLVLKDIRAGTS